MSSTTTTSTTSKKSNTVMWWVAFVISMILMVAFLVFLPEWFWVMLPFVGTSLILAIDWM